MRRQRRRREAEAGGRMDTDDAGRSQKLTRRGRARACEPFVHICSILSNMSPDTYLSNVIFFLFFLFPLFFFCQPFLVSPSHSFVFLCLPFLYLLPSARARLPTHPPLHPQPSIHSPAFRVHPRAVSFLCAMRLPRPRRTPPSPSRPCPSPCAFPAPRPGGVGGGDRKVTSPLYFSFLLLSFLRSLETVLFFIYSVPVSLL